LARSSIDFLVCCERARCIGNGQWNRLLLYSEKLARRKTEILFLVVHSAYHALPQREAGMAPRTNKKEFRTSVILTEAQHRRVLDIALANDASIAWVLRQALDQYLEALGKAQVVAKPNDASDRQ
jgi:hypothetical protein